MIPILDALWSSGQFIVLMLLTLVLTLWIRARALKIAETVVRSYTRLLSVGLPDIEKVRRLEEILVDFHEQKTLLRAEGYSPDLTSVLVLERLFRGVWHDVMWRVEISPAYSSENNLIVNLLAIILKGVELSSPLSLRWPTAHRLKYYVLKSSRTGVRLIHTEQEINEAYFLYQSGPFDTFEEAYSWMNSCGS